MQMPRAAEVAREAGLLTRPRGAELLRVKGPRVADLFGPRLADLTRIVSTMPVGPIELPELVVPGPAGGAIGDESRLQWWAGLSVGQILFLLLMLEVLARATWLGSDLAGVEVPLWLRDSTELCVAAAAAAEGWRRVRPSSG